MYRIFYAERDTTLYERYPEQNTGIDQILELTKIASGSKYQGQVQSKTYNSRVLIDFGTEITTLSSSISSGNIAPIGTGANSASVYLNLRAANANDLLHSYTIEAYPISESWVNGNGNYSDSPIQKYGASWYYRDSEDLATAWNTASLESSLGTTETEGGGSWFLGSSLKASQTFTNESPDIRMDVTNIISNWIQGKIDSSDSGIPTASMQFVHVPTGSATEKPDEIIIGDVHFTFVSSSAGLQNTQNQIFVEYGHTGSGGITPTASAANLVDSINLNTSLHQLPITASQSDLQYSSSILIISGTVEGTSANLTVTTGSEGTSTTTTLNFINPVSLVGGTSTQTIDNPTPNNGFIIKRSDSEESSSEILGSLKFFGRESHTIYVPKLEVVWNDTTFTNTGSTEISADIYVPYFKNIKSEYRRSEIAKFRIGVRPEFPNKAFQTSSFYLTGERLPTSSYYSIVDSVTDEVLIPFDTKGTQIDCDVNGSFMKLRMDSFMPERFYKIMLKIERDGANDIQTYDNFYFKVVK